MDKLNLIQNELFLNHIPIHNILKEYPLFLEYFEILLFLKPHENKKIDAGIIISNKSLPIKYDSFKSDDLKFTDGLYSFLFVNGKKKSVIFFPNIEIDDEKLVSLTLDKIIIIQRISDKIKIFYQGNVFLCNNRYWLIKENISNAIYKTIKCAPQVDETTFTKIISFAYYHLSHYNIGATLVYLITNKLSLHGLKNRRNSLNITEPKHRLLLKSYLNQIDGATFIDSKGNIISSEIHLKTTDKSIKIISQSTGTRHTSARRYSYDKADCIIVTVSEDGPVSIFSDGINIATLNEYSISEDFGNIGKLAEEYGNSYGEEESEATCSNCGKKNIIYSNSVSGGWDEREIINCALCDVEITTIKCMSYKTHIIKDI